MIIFIFMLRLLFWLYLYLCHVYYFDYIYIYVTFIILIVFKFMLRSLFRLYLYLCYMENIKRRWLYVYIFPRRETLTRDIYSRDWTLNSRIHPRSGETKLSCSFETNSNSYLGERFSSYKQNYQLPHEVGDRLDARVEFSVDFSSNFLRQLTTKREIYGLTRCPAISLSKSSISRACVRVGAHVSI